MKKIKRVLLPNLINLAVMALGIFLFFLSFKIGESTWVGGITHLLGCGLSCSGLHGLHDVKMEEEIHPHGHH